MNPLVRYTAARLGLFVVAFAVLWGVGYAVGLRWTSVTALWTALVALAVSAAASFVLLRGMRDELAARVQARAERMNQRFEESRRAEDLD